jgi:coenzyme Q-binding protein COQ10
VTAHSETRIVPYPASLMFQVVADVEKYPEFLPWVVALRILKREQVREHEVLFAEMAVGYGALRERYTSRVVLDPIGMRIDVTQTEGPFKRLENHWKFRPAEGGSQLDFAILFEFKSRLLNAVAGAAFEKVLIRMADAFEARAKALTSCS